MTPIHENRFRLEDASENGREPQDSPTAAGVEREDRLLAAIQEYKLALEAGGRPDRRALLERHPDIAVDLSACLDGLAFVQSAAAQLPGAIMPPPDCPFPSARTPDGANRADEPADDADPIDLSADAGGIDSPGGLKTRALGDFRLVKEIGRGGMGVVYEAVQLSLGRRVAVKVLPLASALDPRHLQRFRNEAQAAAQLHHTNIVPVYAVGCDRSVHFYAMQLIEGQSLADVIRELRQAAGRMNNGEAAGGALNGPADRLITPAPALSRRPSGAERVALPRSGGSSQIPRASAAMRRAPASRSTHTSSGSSLLGSSHSAASLSSLRSSKGGNYFRAVTRLWLQAAEALDYAHRAGVVHRDIKPANLLLDGQGDLWVTDFGLAQFYADDNLTRSGDLLGTLRYMSPEQASGRAAVLDQRTDIYSLGVTIYELLTLERALPGVTREQLLHQIGSHDPRPARSVDRTIPAELETILGKAAAKEPADRYPSARALADDLRRYLQDEPILARPPSAWDRSVKWTRRHKALAVSAFVVVCIAAIGLLASTLLIAREQAKTQAAFLRERDEAAEARRQRTSAATSFGQARDAVGFFSRVAADELADSPSAAEVRKELLEAALDYYQGFVEAHGKDPTVGADLNEARTYVSKILSELSAFAAFDRVESRARLLGEPSVRTALNLSVEQATAAYLVGDRLLDDQALDVHAAGDGPDAGGPRDDGGPGARGGGRSLRGLTSEEKRKRYAASAARIEAALDAVLTPAQAERLRQIDRQVRGTAAFADPDVVAALGLTREQKDAVRRAQAEFRIAMRKNAGRSGPPDGRGRDGARDAGRLQQSLQEKALEQVLARLSPPQRATWERLVGPPFAAASSLYRGPFGADKPPGPGGPADHGPDNHGPGYRAGNDEPFGSGGPNGPGERSGPAAPGGHDGPGEPGGPDRPGGPDGPNGHDGPWEPSGRDRRGGPDGPGGHDGPRGHVRPGGGRGPGD